jgi:uncharacterized YigZ family protein
MRRIACGFPRRRHPILFEPAGGADVSGAVAAAELCVKKSRFIAEIFRVTTPAEARGVIKAQKAAYSGASHVVHAFITGKNGESRGMSDDGEPAGTAARPVMSALSEKYTNILLTVTRYFGGTLLGTGGLVKAYGASAKAVCASCVFAPASEKISVTIHTPYDCYERCIRALQALNAQKINTAFDEDARIICEIAHSEDGAEAALLIARLKQAVGDASDGRAVFCRPPAM